jgi:hypothetical protein
MIPHGRGREIARWRDVTGRSRPFGRDAPQAVTMVCRTLSVGGESSIAMPRVYRRFEQFMVSSLRRPQRFPSLRSLRRAGAIHPHREALWAGNSSPLSRIIPTAGRMCVLRLPQTQKRPRRQPRHRAKHTLPIERCNWPSHSRKASFFVGVFVWRKAAANPAHPRMINPNEGVDQFGHATQAIGPKWLP